MADTDQGETGPPRSWVEDFYASEREVRNVLDETRDDHLLGEYETVRERLRAFARAEEGIFRVVALSVAGIDAFFDDVESQYGDGEERAPTTDLRALGTEYDRLSTPLELVLAEETKELHNPSPMLRYGFGYSASSGLPRLKYDLYSGDVPLCEFVHPPSQALTLARNVVDSTCELLERVAENEDEVSEVERRRLGVVYEYLSRDVERLGTVVDAPETAFDGDEDPAEDDPRDAGGFEDWSFY